MSAFTQVTITIPTGWVERAKAIARVQQDRINAGNTLVGSKENESDAIADALADAIQIGLEELSAQALCDMAKELSERWAGRFTKDELPWLDRFRAIIRDCE